MSSCVLLLLWPNVLNWGSRMSEYRQCAYCTVLGLYCSQINHLVSTGSNGLWHCVLLYCFLSPWKWATVFLQPLITAAKATTWAGIYGDLNHPSVSTDLKPAEHTEGTCLSCPPFKCSPDHVSLFAYFQHFDVYSWLCISHHHDGQLSSVSCLYSLKRFYPRKHPGTEILGSFSIGSLEDER